MKHAPIRPTLGLLATLGLFLSMGCSQKVYTDVSRKYPAGSHGTEVIVFNPDQTPPPAEELGQLSVKDGEFTLRRPYEELVADAKKAVIKVGGNGLHVTRHLDPKTTTDTLRHQIDGRMLYIPDTLYRDMVSEVRQAEAVRAASIPKSNHAIYLNLGYGYIASKIFTPENTTLSGNAQHGFNFDLGYNWYSGHIYGVGGLYSQYFGTAIISQGNRSAKVNFALKYIGPEATFQTTKFKHWILRLGIGIGYANYMEKLGKEKVSYGGLGFHITAGAEYKINKHVGIGIVLSEYLSIFYQYNLIPKGLSSAQIDRLSATAGVHLYF